MEISVSKDKASKLSRCLLASETIEVLGVRINGTAVIYEIDAPEFFEFPDWVSKV